MIQVTLQANASTQPGTYTVQVVSAGAAGGQGFQNGGGQSSATSSPGQFQVQAPPLKVTITNADVTQDQITVALSGAPYVTGSLSSGTFDVSSDLPLTAIDGHFVSDDRLVIMGNAGKADAVVIFDLSQRSVIDRFYCYEPRRISENWIVYVEYYPAHSTAEPTDVVLLYDLGRDPSANRMEKPSNITVPQNPSIVPTRVGIPVFPELNAKQRSYSNFVSDPSLAHHVLGPPFFYAPALKTPCIRLHRWNRCSGLPQLYCRRGPVQRNK